MKVVLDTNCFIRCIGKKSAYRKIFDSFLDGKYSLCLSNEVLFEYAEKFLDFFGYDVSYNLIETIASQSNISYHLIYFNFRLVDRDEDDNKFADLYLSAAADVLVSNDKQLLALQKADYPKFNVMTLEDFALLI